MGDRTTRSSALLGLVLFVVAGLLAVTPARAAGPEGQITWGVHISLAPTWFDPAETPGIITPFMILYALHDAARDQPGRNPWILQDHVSEDGIWPLIWCAGAQYEVQHKEETPGHAVHGGLPFTGIPLVRSTPN